MSEGHDGLCGLVLLLLDGDGRRDSQSRHLEAIRKGAGLARRSAEALGVHLPPALPDYQTLRNEAYDALIDEMEARALL